MYFKLQEVFVRLKYFESFDPASTSMPATLSSSVKVDHKITLLVAVDTARIKVTQIHKLQVPLEGKK